ncbi:MAG: tRNA lysidine(34) synthetase TilS [Anaerolineae bacterium]|nr:tRNA lysidine(34) synthetase TilS [Anaerolineae bacterium]
MDLLPVVEAALRRHRMAAPGEAVVVGVSGGPDSLCLLHVLHRLAPAWSLRLHAAHLNHGLRGDEADADADFVAATAAAWGLPYTVERADVAALAAASGASLEEAARHARYAFLARVAGRVGAHAIAVGHTGDDQAETVLMHFLRGSGLAGLRGMLPVTPLTDYRLLAGDAPEAADLRLIRPLLDVPRAEVLAYCRAHGLQPRFDRSNEDTTFFRNRLRHQLLPLLETYNPQVRRVLRHTATVLADDYALLRGLAEAAWAEVFREETADGLVLDLPRWRALPTGLQRAVLRQAIGRRRRSLRNINFVHVERALEVLRTGQAGARATLPAGLEAVVGYDCFVVGEAGVGLPAGDAPQLTEPRLPLALPGVTGIGNGWQVETALLAPADLPTDWRANPDPWRAWLDADAVGPGPALRTRRPGDRFQPLGMAGHSKLLAEFFTNLKVSPSARDRWPLLVNTADEIAWVCGLRVDQRAAITPATQRVLQVVMRRVGGATRNEERATG